ncbi:peroxisomal biogenesis factor 6-like isoform X13 [Carya illinoinensis]|uniref:peroxisomal biogenesis factor 6-like isoform X13 n=1 Tax=Carya illinoinensis TaxID=32201 RepID=UPI001C71C7D1|nr:peroxisomal biogenesis factor 6-like isoform X13 [Carya illinoinensis]
MHIEVFLVQFRDLLNTRVNLMHLKFCQRGRHLMLGDRILSFHLSWLVCLELEWLNRLMQMVMRLLSNLLCHQNLLQVMRSWKKLPRKNDGGLKSCLEVKECNVVLILALLWQLTAKSAVAWQLTLNPLEKRKEVDGDVGYSKDINSQYADLCILIFRSLVSSEKAEIEFIKQGSLTPKELDAFVSVLELAARRLAQNKTLERRQGEGTACVPSAKNSVPDRKSAGVRIYGLNEPRSYSPNKEISWDNIAGYDQQKRISRTGYNLCYQPVKLNQTRRKFESNKPRAVLFEGPPGTGKTSCAHIIANQPGVPLLYVPLEVVLSRYYGESRRLLGRVFSHANEFHNGAIIFLG